MQTLQVQKNDFSRLLEDEITSIRCDIFGPDGSQIEEYITLRAKRSALRILQDKFLVSDIDEFKEYILEWYTDCREDLPGETDMYDRCRLQGFMAGCEFVLSQSVQQKVLIG